MKTFVSMMTAAVLTLGVATTSQAKDEVAFSYNPDASVEKTYEALNQQATKICKDELGAFRQYGLRKCASDYMEQIVEKIDRVELYAYHNRMISGSSDIIELAQLED